MLNFIRFSNALHLISLSLQEFVSFLSKSLLIFDGITEATPQTCAFMSVCVCVHRRKL